MLQIAQMLALGERLHFFVSMYEHKNTHKQKAAFKAKKEVSLAWIFYFF